MTSPQFVFLARVEVPPLPQRTLPGGFTVGERAVILACFCCILEMSERLR